MKLPVTLMFLLACLGFVSGCSFAEWYGERHDLPTLRAKAIQYGTWGIGLMIACLIIQFLHFLFHQGGAY